MMRVLIQEFLVRAESVVLVVLVVAQIIHVYHTSGACQAFVLGSAYFGIVLGAWWAAFKACKRHREELDTLRRKIAGEC